MVQGGGKITGHVAGCAQSVGRMISVGTNALASSIVLALRPRPRDASTIDRRTFVAELRDAYPRSCVNSSRAR